MRRSCLKSAFWVVAFSVCNLGSSAQNIIGLPSLHKLDSTNFTLEIVTDSVAVISVHASEDSTYAQAFIFLGRTVGKENKATIELSGLRNNTDYQYRILIGTTLSQIGGTFTTGNRPKK